MSGYTVTTPDDILATRLEGGQIQSLSSQFLRDAFVSAMSVVPIVSTVTRTLVLTDAWKVIEFNNGTTPVSLLIPTDASVNFAIGTVIDWFVLGSGAGVLTIAAVTPGTTTVRTSSSNTARAQNSSGSIRKRAANDWELKGDLT